MNKTTGEKSMSKTPSFESFMERWEAKQEKLLDELSAAKNGRVDDEKTGELITRALLHFEEFYEEKSRAAHCHVFGMFAPEWCSPLECAYFWISGFCPTAMLRLAYTVIDDLSPHQLLQLDSLKSDLRVEEKALSDEQARIQRSMAAPAVANALRRIGWQPVSVTDWGPQSDVEVQTVKDAMEALVGNADNLRGRTAAGMVKLLTMEQSICLLEAAVNMQKNMKIWGKERQAGLQGINGLV